MPDSASPATDLDLISYLKAIPHARMRRGVRIPAWYLLLVGVLSILSKCESLRVSSVIENRATGDIEM